MMLESETLPSGPRLRICVMIVLGAVVIWGAVALLMISEDSPPPESCLTALSDIDRSARLHTADIEPLMDRFVAAYPPGDQIAAEKIVAGYRQHDAVLRRAVGVCPGRTVDEIRSEIDRVARAREDIERACRSANRRC